MFEPDISEKTAYGLSGFANLDDIDSILAAEGALSMAADNAYTELLEETNAVLQQASHRFQELFQGLPVSCFCYAANGDIYEWNRECEKASGTSAVEALQHPIWDVFCAPEHADQMKSMVDAVFAGANFEGIEIEALRSDGATYPVLCSMFPLRGFDGNIVGGISANVNITERKKAEDELRKSREMLEERVAMRTSELASVNETLAAEVHERKLYEQELKRMHEENAQLLAAIGSIMIGIDAKHRIITWNAVAERAIGIKTKQAVGKLIDELHIDWEWEKIEIGLVKCIETQGPVRLDDIRYQVEGGKSRFLGMTVNPLAGQGGAITGYLILGTDITERRVLEGQLAQAQKLESIGQLAAGIAHEINTPIQYVGDNTRFVFDAFEDLKNLIGIVEQIIEGAEETTIEEIRTKLEAAKNDADVDYLMQEVPRAITQSLEGVQRVAHIVRAMKEFSHPGKEEKTGVDLNQALDSTITVARNEWKYIADLVTDFDPDLPVVPCLPGDLNQVFLNMIINAAHAISDVVADTPNKGTITISTSHTDSYIEIRISDTGTGIPIEAQGRIFDPFFTTKAIGKGTGQGLAISHNVVVDKHGGTISFETEQGLGTTFIIQLPLAEGSPKR